MTSVDVEFAVAEFFGWRTNLIVPNVHWGFGMRYEADMLIITPANWVTEVEIKITKADCKADQGKHYHHDDRRVKKLFFALPIGITNDCLPLIQADAGIIAVDLEASVQCKVIRAPQTRRQARKITTDERHRLLHLAAMRIWDLKRHVNILKQEKK